MPHLGRLLVGEDNRYLMPASALLGALFMIIVDTVARNLTGSEIPLSIITGLLGAPLFLWLLARQKTRFS
jgi:iron complex transport system permease protein